MNFNKAQLGAIEHKDGAMLVLAGPGSGKTAVITHRTKNLITKHHVKPSEILVITFTKAAANEMKERFNFPDKAVSHRLISNIGTCKAICIFEYRKKDSMKSNKRYVHPLVFHQ